jgi:hypothetical protein
VAAKTFEAISLLQRINEIIGLHTRLGAITLVYKFETAYPGVYQRRPLPVDWAFTTNGIWVE